ncbi:hypothetical protein LCGC14_2567040, partial [marine sediment metagenome]
MSNQELHVVTGAFGYSGKYIARRLLDAGHRVRTLTNSLKRHNPFGDRVEARPLDFDDESKMAESLRGATVLYNTYWVRFNHKAFKHAGAVENTLTMFRAAKQAGLDAIGNDQSHYCPSIGLPEMRQAASDFVNQQYGTSTTAENIVVGPGAKIFELLFCETFLNPGDGVLVFSPYFPTYVPNISRRGARVWLSDLKQENEFRPNLDDVQRFLDEDSQPKAIFLNSPHNPTGGVATEEDLQGLAEIIRGRDVALFSDEPYDRMVWRGQHHTITALPGMLDQCVAAYTFSKSYSMSGWRLGFAVTGPEIAGMFGKLINTCLSCTPPLVQLAGVAAMKEDNDESHRTMGLFREKVEILVEGLNQIDGIKCLDPGGTFYVFPSVAAVCNRLKITSHGLA